MPDPTPLIQTVGRGVVIVRAAHTIRNVQSILGQNVKGLIVQSMFPCSQSNRRECVTEKNRETKKNYFITQHSRKLLSRLDLSKFSVVITSFDESSAEYISRKYVD